MDQAICNADWDLFAPDCTVRHLYQLKSDHRSILIVLAPMLSRGKRPFRCLTNWFLHSDFSNLVTNKWCDQVGIGENLQNMKEALVVWNKVFGNIFVRKRRLVSELSRV